MIKVFLLAVMVVGFTKASYGVDAFYLGGDIGYVNLTGRTAALYNHTIGFGLDFGFRTGANVDLTLGLGASSHSGSGGLTLFSPTLSADIMLAEINDFEFLVGGGPGFYFFKDLVTTESKFGLNFGGVGNVVLDNIRIGLGYRYHMIFNGTTSDNYWTLMMRFGYLFDLLG